MGDMSSDRFRLDGQTALVTGGAGFLGRRWVSALLDAGAAVISVDLASDARQETGQPVLHEEVDITDPRAVASLADRLAATDSRVDVLVNNAAVDAPVSASGLARSE